MDNEFKCSACNRTDIPPTKRWVMHDKDICVSCMFKKTIKGIEPITKKVKELNWVMTSNGLKINNANL